MYTAVAKKLHWYVALLSRLYTISPDVYLKIDLKVCLMVLWNIKTINLKVTLKLIYCDKKRILKSNSDTFRTFLTKCYSIITINQMCTQAGMLPKDQKLRALWRLNSKYDHRRATTNHILWKVLDQEKSSIFFKNQQFLIDNKWKIIIISNIIWTKIFIDF